MARPKSYETAAEKQKAYRERKKKNFPVSKAERSGALAGDAPKSGMNLTAVPVLAESSVRHSGTTTLSEARESTTHYHGGTKEPRESRGGSQRPSEATEREWEHALLRAGRARKYAQKRFVRPSDLKYQDPVWQWENEVRGRFTSPVGGSLSGTRSQPS